MKALKEEIGTAERIQKLLDEEVKEQNQAKDKANDKIKSTTNENAHV